jgi:hypothetical protein
MRASATHRLRIPVLVGWGTYWLTLLAVAVWLSKGVAPMLVRSSMWVLAFAFAGNSVFCTSLLLVPAIQAWACERGERLKGDRSGLVVAAALTAAAAVGTTLDALHVRLAVSSLLP